MAKEQELHDEILAGSPLLDTFLNYNGPHREAEIERLLDSTLERMREAKGKEYVQATMQTSFILLGHNNLIADGVPLLIALGFELANSSDDTRTIGIFDDEITQRAFEDEMLGPGIKDTDKATDVLDALFDIREETPDLRAHAAVTSLLFVGFMVAHAKF